MSGSRLPKYRRHSSNRGFVEHEKKRLYFPGPYNSPESTDAYRKFIREVCGGIIGSGPLVVPDSIAIICEAFLAAAEIKYPGKRGTYGNLQSAVLPFSMKYGSLHPNQFGPKRLLEWQAILAKAKKSRGYINDCVRRLRQMFKWAVAEELIPASIHHALTAVPGLKRGQTEAIDHAPRRMVQRDIVEAVLPFLSPTIRGMVELQWLTGVRSRSLCLAKPEQFRLDVLPWEWRPRHKQEHTGAELVVYIGPKARAILAPLLAIPSTAPTTDYLFRPRTIRKNRRYGSFYTSGSYRQAVERGIERANAARAKDDQLPDWTPHRVRHSKSTLVRESHGLEAAQATLGQKSLQAAQIYAERQTKDARRIAESDG